MKHFILFFFINCLSGWWLTTDAQCLFLEGEQNTCVGNEETYVALANNPNVAEIVWDLDVTAGQILMTSGTPQDLQTATIDWLTSGEHTILISGLDVQGELVSGCTASIEVNVFDIPHIEIGGPTICERPGLSNTVCMLSPTAFFAVNPTSTAVYSWTIDGSPAGSGTTLEYTPGTSGPFTICLSAIEGDLCTASKCDTYNAVTPPVTSIEEISLGTSSLYEICNNQDLTFISSYFQEDDIPQSGVSWSLFLNNTLINYGNSETFNHLFSISGLYTLELYVTDCFGCVSTVQSVQIQVDAATAYEIICPSVVCEGDIVPYSVMEDAPCTFNWTVDGGAIVSGTGTNSIEVLWGNVPTGYGSVQLEVGNCGDGCPFPTIVDVPVLPTSGMEIEILSAPECSDFNPTYHLGVPPFPGATYSWEYEILNTITSGNINEFSSLNLFQISTGGFAGDIQIELTIDHPIAGCMITDNITIKPRKYNLTAPFAICEDQNATNVSIAPIPQGDFTLTWQLYFNGAEVNSGESSTASFPIDGFNASGEYTLTVTITEGDEIIDCSLTKTIIKEEAVPPIEEISGELMVCEGESYCYIAMPTNPPIIEWEITNGTITSSNTGNTIIVEWESGEPKTLSARRKVNGCYSEYYTIEVSSLQHDGCTIQNTEDTFTHCKDGTVSYFIDGQDEMENIVWEINPSFAGSVIEGNGTAEVSIQWHQYDFPFIDPTVIVKYTFCGQEYSCEQVVTLIDGPEVTIDGPKVACNTDPITFSATPADTEAYSYEWFLNGQLVDNATDPSLTLNLTDPEEYTISVLVSGTASCPGPFSATHVVKVIDIPEPLITTPDIACWEQGPFTFDFFVEGYNIDDITAIFNWSVDGVDQNINTTSFSHEFTFTSNIDFAIVSVTVDILDEDDAVLCTLSDEYIVTAPCGDEGEPCPFEVQIVDWDFLDDEPFQFQCGEVRIFGTAPNNFTQGQWQIENAPSGVNPNEATFFSPPGLEEDFSIFDKAGYYPALLNITIDGTTCTNREVIEIPLRPDFEWQPICPEEGSSQYGIQLTDISNLLDGVTVAQGDRVWSVNGEEVGNGATDFIYTPEAGLSEIEVCLRPTTFTIRPPWNGIEYICQICKTIDLPEVPVVEIATTTMQGCVDTPIQFAANISSGEVMTYAWNIDYFGLSYNSNLPNPFFTIPNAGVYTVELTTTDYYGCTYQAEREFEVTQTGIFGIIEETALSCNEGAELIYNNLLGPDIIDYQWEPGGSTMATNLASVSGVYDVTVTNSIGCTYSPPSYSLVLTAPFSQGLFAPSTVCAGDPVNISTSLNLSAGYEYNWYQNGNLLPNATNSSAIIEVLDYDSSIPFHTFTIIATDQTTGDNCAELSVVIEVLPLPDPVAIKYNFECAPLQVQLETVGGESVLWLQNGQSIGAGASVTATGSGIIQAVVLNDNGCDNDATFVNIEGPIDLSPVLSGCYTLCDTALANLNYCLEGVPGMFQEWAWVLIFDDETETTLLENDGTNPTVIENLCLTEDMEGKIVLRVSRTYENSDGSTITCEEESLPFCLEIEECTEVVVCDIPDPTVRTVTCQDDVSTDDHQFHIHWDYIIDPLVAPCSFDYGTVNIYDATTQQVVGVFEWIDLDNINGYHHFEGIAVVEPGTDPLNLCWTQTFCVVATGEECGVVEVCTTYDDIYYLECEPEDLCNADIELLSVDCLSESGDIGIHQFNFNLGISVPIEFQDENCQPYTVNITSNTGVLVDDEVGPWGYIEIPVDASNVINGQIVLDNLEIDWSDQIGIDFACFGVFVKPMSRPNIG